MKVNVTKNAVSITEYNQINSGERGVNICKFQLPEEFSSLSVTASFNNIPVPVCDGECIIPTLKKGTAILGVYAYKENAEGVELMYSPKPTAFYVNEGSYSDEIGREEMPSLSDYEKICKSFTDSVLKNLEDVEKTTNKTETITEKSTHDQYPTAKAVYDLVGDNQGSGEIPENVQEQLVSGENIKTINGVSLLGSGNINIEGTSVDGIPAEVVNSIGQTVRYKDITDTFTLKTGGIQTSSGKFVSGKTTGKGTDFFAVTKGEKYRVTGCFTWSWGLIALYSEANDGNKEFIKSLGYYQNGNMDGAGSIEYTIPETEIKCDNYNQPILGDDGNPIELTVTHMICSTSNTVDSSLIVEKEVTELKSVQEELEDVREEIQSFSGSNKVAIDIVQNGESIKAFTVENGGLNESGTTNSVTTRKRTGFIPVYGNNIRLSVPQGLLAYIWEFDENKSFVKYDGWHTGTVEYEVSNPYIRLTVKNDKSDNTITTEQVQEIVVAEYSPLFDESGEDTDTQNNTEVVLTEAENLACEKFSSLFVSTTGRTESLIFFTDPHLCTSLDFKPSFASTLDRIKAVYNSIPVSTCVCGGDWISTGNTKENAVSLLGKIDCAMRSRFKKYINVLGNHDTNYMGYEYGESGGNRDEAANCILTNKTPSNLWYRNHGRNYFTVDGDCTKFYVFDTGIDDWHYVYGIGNVDDWYTQVLGMTVTEYKNEQIDWFAKSLWEDDPERCAFLLHVGSSKYVATSFVNNITSIAKAFNDKTSITYNNITYDFSETTGHLYFALAGHAHVDMQYVANDIPVVLTVDLAAKDAPTEEIRPAYDLVLADYGANKLRLVRVGGKLNHSTDDFDENNIRTFDMA